MPKFNTALGTLTGVTLYFYFSETVSSLSITNNSGTGGDFEVAVISDPFTSFTNTANALDTFVDDTFTVFDTGIPTNTALGSCHNNGGTDIPPGNCAPITLGAGGTYSIASNGYPSGYSLNVNDTAYQNDPLAPGGYHWITGPGGVSGLRKAISSSHDSSYGQSGGGTFDLTGTSSTNYSAGASGGGGSVNLNVQYTLGLNLNAEVDYTYTDPPAVPEPATMGLFGSALVGLIAFRKRFKR